MVKPILFLGLFIQVIMVFAQEETGITVYPKPYEKALKNPMKGFTTTNGDVHPWATLTHTYIRWNELENDESDGIEKIIQVSNEKWKNVAARNMKVIPRVYLHWDAENEKYWPADMQTGDYTSEQFQARVLRLIKRLGACWDNDPRVAFVEMGIIGKWGEHHSPSPTVKVQKLLSDAFAKAFKNKKVSVRQNWAYFTEQPFGEYWDSWAHFDEMWSNGNSIKQLNKDTGRYKENYIGGEVAYNWGNYEIQPGASPTQSVAVQKHRNFVLNSIRWLHCTQLRWISNYDKFNSGAIAGAEEMQKAFGYRYELNEVKISLNDSLKIAFEVINTGSAPFYYNWPVEVALLDSVTHKPVWKATMDNVDIRNWLPGENWTDPQWKYVGSWQQYQPDEFWNPSKQSQWETPPATNRVEDKFKIDPPHGTYILSLAILDPAGDLPGIKFATGNYLNGGRHPMGLVYVGENKCDTLPPNFHFDDPNADNSLHYDVDFEIIYEEDSIEIAPVRTPFEGKAWQFPADSVSAWQYDFMNNKSGAKFFSLDSANTIGLYGCNDTTGLNIRLYKDSVQIKDAAQFKWNETAGTFQKNGQWIEYSADFKLNLPYQLQLRARNNADTNFKLTILSSNRDTVYFNDFSLKTDFENLGGGNDQTDWFLSNNQIEGLWGIYTIRFDWYDNPGDPGIFGGFSFPVSKLDLTPPNWYYVGLGTFTPGTNIVVITTENATVYLVPDGTLPDIATVKSTAVSFSNAEAFKQANLATTGLNAGDYIVYAIDSSNNISVASKVIVLQNPVSAAQLYNDSEISVTFNQASQFITAKSSGNISQIVVYNILGKKTGSKKGNGNTSEFKTDGLISGVYLVHVFTENKSVAVKKVVVN
ncbi:MAG TPA: DUF4832 domain-containing protein [Draconibacterium sp.]|nr:DUF4832 domain-containing protein [Draconibacterium sp.]